MAKNVKVDKKTAKKIAEKKTLAGKIRELTDEQSESIDKCGTAENIKVNIYDTKNRKYVVKDIPELKLDVSFFNGDEEIILAPVELIDDYERLSKGVNALIC